MTRSRSRTPKKTHPIRRSSRGKSESVPRKASRSRSRSRPKEGREHPGVRKALARVARCIANPHYKVLSMLKDVPDSKFDGKDSKLDKAVLDLKDDLLAAREMMRAALGNKPITVKIYERYNAVSGVATAFSTVKNLVPGGAGQFSSFAALFDEYKAVAVTTVLRATPQVNSAQTVAPMWIACYDWGVAGALTSITSGLSQTNHMYGIIDLGGNQTMIPNGNKHGFAELDARIPEGVMADVGIITDLMSGLWVPTSDNAAIVGYMKPYIDAAGGAGVTSLTGFIGYEVEFRCRG